LLIRAFGFIISVKIRPSTLLGIDNEAKVGSLDPFARPPKKYLDIGHHLHGLNQNFRVNKKQ